MKKVKISDILFVLFIIIGLFIMSYPFIAERLSLIKYGNIIVDYNEKVKKISMFDSYFEEAERYNKTINNLSIIDSFSRDVEYNYDQEYLKLLNINNDGVMGYLKIPKLGCEIPIYHGTSENVLQNGAGHFEGSSLPVGGKGTHAVISAHSGLPSARLFSDLDQLKIGDMFYIYVYDRVLAYKIDEIVTVLPSEVDRLKIEDGKDYVTLLTCTPYAVNTHRLLVRGSRVEYNKKVLENIKVERKLSISDYIFISGIVVVIIMIIVSIIIVRKINKKQIEKNIKD